MQRGTGSRQGALKGLSRVRANSHARFLGGDGSAMARLYPIHCHYELKFTDSKEADDGIHTK